MRPFVNVVPEKEILTRSALHTARPEELRRHTTWRTAHSTAHGLRHTCSYNSMSRYCPCTSPKTYAGESICASGPNAAQMAYACNMQFASMQCGPHAAMLPLQHTTRSMRAFTRHSLAKASFDWPPCMIMRRKRGLDGAVVCGRSTFTKSPSFESASATWSHRRKSALELITGCRCCLLSE